MSVTIWLADDLATSRGDMICRPENQPEFPRTSTPWCAGWPSGTTQPLFCDPYDRNRLNGGFIPVEEGTKVTVGAGMITQTD